MQRSTERILTTHVGSLPRPDDLFDLMLARMDGNAIDERAYAERVRGAVKDCVRQQVDAGLDVVNDGEMGKPSFITYAASRLSGLEKREGFRPSPFANTRETARFPGLLSLGNRRAGQRPAPPRVGGLHRPRRLQRPCRAQGRS